MKYYLCLCLFSICHFLPAQDTVRIAQLLKSLETAKDTQKVNLLNELADQYGRYQPEKSLFFVRDAWQLAQTLNYQRGMAAAASNFGVANELQAHYLEALDYHLKALRIYENLQETEGIAMTFSNIALLYYRQNTYEQALRYCHKAQEANGTAEKDAQISIWTNYAKIYAKTNKTDSAVWFLRKALALSNSRKNPIYQSICLNNFGLIYKEEKNYTEALNYFLQALQIAQDFNNPFMQMLDLKQIGHIYILIENYDRALQYERSALNIAQSFGIRDHCKDIANYLAIIYKQKQQYDSAFFYLEKYNRLRDEIYNQDKERKFAQLEAHYNLDKQENETELLRKESEYKEQTIKQQKLVGGVFAVLLVMLLVMLIALLRINHQRKKNNDLLEKTQEEILRQKMMIEERNGELITANEKLTANEKELMSTNRKLQITEKAIRRQNESIMKQKEELERLNNIKDKLFSIIAHDFKSPLHSLKGMLQLLTMGVLTTEEIQTLATDINEKNEHTLNLIDNLLHWAKSQMKGVEVKPQNIDIQAITDETLALLKPQADKKDTVLLNKIETAAWAYADPDMIKLVVRNLVSNAIKFTAAGTVSVSGEIQENQIITQIKDTGTGISPENIEKLFGADAHFTTVGTHKEKGTGLGLMLCKSFLERNGGKIWVESQEGKGTTFYFSLPTNHDMFLDFEI